MARAKRIAGYEKLYTISRSGVVFSLSLNKVVTPYLNGDGYVYVKLWKDGIKHSVSVSRSVATAYIPNPDNKPEVNHKKGNKLDNRASQLEWTTQKENFLHSVEAGLNKRVKLNYSKVEEIKRLLNNGMKGTEIGSLYGVTRSCISSIKTNRVWKAA